MNMFGQIFAFFAVATSVAFATTCGFCYPGYGSYVSSVPTMTNGVCNGGFYAPRVLGTGYATPVFEDAVGAPEVISSCENSFASPVVAGGLVSSSYYGSGYGLGYGCGSSLGGYGTGAIASAC